MCCTSGMLHEVINNLLWITLTQEAALAVGDEYVSLDPFTKLSSGSLNPGCTSVKS